MPSGFITERTAEYVLVPELINRLEREFSHVVPFYFWQSREGQAKARASYSGPVRLIACYARRPKIGRLDDREIQVKFNSLLPLHAWELGKLGIPLLVGVPCVSNFIELRLGAPCVWFSLDPQSRDWGDAIAQVSLDGRSKFDLYPPDFPARGPLCTPEILQIVRESTDLMPWPEMFERIRMVNRRLNQHDGYYERAWFGRFLPYKPFYVAILDNDP